MFHMTTVTESCDAFVTKNLTVGDDNLTNKTKTSQFN